MGGGGHSWRRIPIIGRHRIRHLLHWLGDRPMERHASPVREAEVMAISDTETHNPTTAPPSGKRERLQSSIQFPYGDLETAVEVAVTMHNSGYLECAPDQLAAAMQQQVSSGNFRQKVSAARIFGLIETSPGRIALTDLGFRVLDASQQKRAYAEAFLNVELYRKLYDDFRGKQLPPRPAALERAFEHFGVSPKQTDKARQAFDRSAKQAGFFGHGNDKLVMPGGLDAPPQPDLSHEAHDEHIRTGDGEGGGELPPHLDPLIRALLQKLPREKNWPLPSRAKWLRALAMNLSFVYDADEEDAGEITVSIQSRSLD
jgi:hypothetical protein